MFVSLKRYNEIKKNYEKEVERNIEILNIAKDVRKDNCKLIKICEQLLFENKCLIAENKRIKGDKEKDKN